MALFNPKIPKLPGFPGEYGFKMPSFDMPDFQMPSLPQTPAYERPLSPTQTYGGDYGGDYGDFGGIEPYSMPTETKTTTQSDYKWLFEPKTWGASGLFPSGRQATSGRTVSRGTQLPYGTASFWMPPTGERPEMGELPEYMTPEISRERIGELTELGMGAPMGRLKEGLNRALLEARYSTNPMVRAMARKQALAGYGAGITDVRTGAHREAMAEYMPEFQAQLTKSQTEYQAKLQKIQTQFQTDITEYMRKGRQITTPLIQLPASVTGSVVPSYRQPRIV